MFELGDIAKTACFYKIKGHNSKVPNTIWLENKLGKDFMLVNNFSKFGIIKLESRQQWNANFDQFKGHYSKVADVIRLDIEFDQDFLPINVLSKFGDNPMKNDQVRC